MSSTETPQENRSQAALESLTNNVAALRQEPSPPGSSRQSRRRSLFWPVVLIGVGAVLLLADLGLISAEGWALLWRFWPIALIALGLDVVIGHRTLGQAIASGVLILLLVGLAIGFALFAGEIPALVRLAQPATMQQQSVSYSADGVESADISIDWTSAPGRLLALADSTNLIEADVSYRGELEFDVSREGDRATVVLDSYLQGVPYGAFDFDDRGYEWDVRLNPDVVLDLALDTSSGSCELDLSGLKAREVHLDSGSGSVHLALPAGQDTSVVIDGGSGSISLLLPESAGVRLVLERGSGSFDPDDRLSFVSGDQDDESVWESENYDTAEFQIDLTVDQGSGSLLIR